MPVAGEGLLNSCDSSREGVCPGPLVVPGWRGGASQPGPLSHCAERLRWLLAQALRALQLGAVNLPTLSTEANG